MCGVCMVTDRQCCVQNLCVVCAFLLIGRVAGHRKAVSYVRYLNGRELVSASTDSTLRLWDTKACTPARVFNGHNNEKNFVGLSVDNDFIACGSETNEVRLVKYVDAACSDSHVLSP